jgi:TonB-dependent SusC/RagA subfamily outer membrane receptor
MQVLNYFSTLTHEKVCGRALPEQLNRTISRPTMQKKRLFWYWNYIVMFLMFFTKGNAAKAQGGIKPITECSPVKQNDINNALAGRVGGVLVRNDSKVISGKVTDIDGNPVSYASVKIKGTPTGVSADAKGIYSLKVNSNDILVISGASFKTAEVPVNNQSVINTVLQEGVMSGQLDVMISGVFGGMIGTRMDYASPDKTKAVAILKVKDEESGKFLAAASVVITKNGSSDTVFTDKKGMYKVKGITAYDRSFIKVSAIGYEGSEFTINETDFKDRKKEWEVLLRKQKVEETRSTATAKPGTETRIRMGAVSDISWSKEPLYVVDGTIMPGKVNINPDDMEKYSVFQGAEAAALFGADGANGAIVITTKKLKVKDLDPVFISTTGLNVGVVKVAETYTRTTTGAVVRGVTIKSRNTIADSLKMFATKLTGAIKVYPNPVQRGNAFNVALKLKQTGLYQIQITDATGRIVLQKPVNALTKEFTENIAADSRWSSGIYYISLIDNKNKLINKTSFIFQ